MLIERKKASKAIKVNLQRNKFSLECESMQKKQTGFTLIELLVVIVIIGILATITSSTFQNSLANARDAKRVSSVKNLASIFRNNGVFREAEGSNNIYTYGPETIQSALQEQGYSNPSIENNICYTIDSINAEGEFLVMTWGESTSTANPGTAGPIYNGTPNMEAKLAYISDQETLTAADFHCIDSDMVTATMIARPEINGIPAFGTGNRLRSDQEGIFCNFSGSYNESTELCDY